MAETIVTVFVEGDTEVDFYKKLIAYLREKNGGRLHCKVDVRNVKSPLSISAKIEAVVKRMKIDGGRVLMAITNTLMMVQAGSPTGVCVVRTRESNHGQG